MLLPKYSSLNESGSKRYKKLGLVLFNLIPQSCEIERLFSLDSLFKRSNRSSLANYRSYNNSIMNSYLVDKYSEILEQKKEQSFDIHRTIAGVINENNTKAEFILNNEECFNKSSDKEKQIQTKDTFIIQG